MGLLNKIFTFKITYLTTKIWDNLNFQLVSNVGRVMSPCLITVNHEGGAFPELQIADNKKLLFDRVVCDVPCSGDGTIRKNPNVWDNWTPGGGNSRHFIQYNIIERAVEMLEVGGLVAYSR